MSIKVKIKKIYSHGSKTNTYLKTVFTTRRTLNKKTFITKLCTFNFK